MKERAEGGTAFVFGSDSLTVEKRISGRRRLLSPPAL
jgi:hypothetical protein